MANNLKDHLKEVADAIRAKKGTNDLINPQDFATEIEGISGGGSGGGTPSGGSMEYVVFNAETDLITFGEFIGMFGYLVKFPNKIEPIGLMVGMGESVNDAIAFAIDPTTEVDFQGERKSVREWGIAFGADLDTLPRITKEQFYDLNA